MYDNQYGYDNNYNNYYQEPKSSHTDIQIIKCVNSNINVNGIGITEISQDSCGAAASNEGAADTANPQNGNGLADRINFDRNLVNVCVNVNQNEQLKTNTVGPVQISTYDVFGEVDTSIDDGRASSSARCDDGDIVLSGSYFLVNAPLLTGNLADGPFLIQQSWEANADGPTSGPKVVAIQIFVVCFDNPPAHTP